MGMSLDEYWRGKPEYARYYREANKLKKKERNFNAWVQGLYVYHANCASSPMFRDLVKDHTPQKYLAEPFDFLPKTKQEEEAKEEAQDLENEAKILDWVSRTNRLFAEKEDVANAR